MENAIEETTVSKYSNRIEPARRAFHEREIVNKLFRGQDVEPVLMNLFLVFWSAGNAGLTEPIEGYLAEAARNAGSKGAAQLSHFLEHHAEEEKGHNLWALDDVRALTDRWNQDHPAMRLDADVLIQRRFTPAVKKYHFLHEKYVRGDDPWGELAIDLEIELMAVKYGENFIQNCVRTLGGDALQLLSFLRLHVEADQGHSEENVRFMASFESEHPEHLPVMLEAGREGLESYGDYLEETMAFALLKYSEYNAIKAR